MKDFLSEHGFAILAAIVVILLIAMCTPVGNLIKNQVMGVVDSFATKTESKLYSMDADNTLGVVIVQDGDEGKFSITATSSSDNDLLNAEYRVKDQNGNWSDWRPLGSLSTGSKEHTGSFTAKIENGNKAQVRVTDSGKADNLYYESNIVEYTGKSSEEESFSSVGEDKTLKYDEDPYKEPEDSIYYFKIGDTKYKSLKDASNNADEGDTIILLKDDSISDANSELTIWDVTLDLNGYNLKVKELYLLFGTIIDSRGGGSIEIDKNSFMYSPDDRGNNRDGAYSYSVETGPKFLPVYDVDKVRFIKVNSIEEEIVKIEGNLATMKFKINLAYPNDWQYIISGGVNARVAYVAPQVYMVNSYIIDFANYEDEILEQRNNHIWELKGSITKINGKFDGKVFVMLYPKNGFGVKIQVEGAGVPVDAN